MILILTHRGDDGSDRVEELLLERGAEVTRFDPADFPARAALSMRFSRAHGWQDVIEREGAPPIDVGAITAVWLRRPGKRTLPDGVAEDPALHRYLLDEWAAVVGDLFTGMDAAWLPARPAVVRETMRKCHPLRLAQRLGLAIPESAFTSRAEDLFALHRAHAGNVITKMPSSIAFPNAFENQLVRFTERLSPRDLGYARRLRTCPVLVQENLAKALELRVTVVGSRVFTAAIDSQASHRTRQDWRRYDHANTPIRVHELAPAVEAACVALTRGLGLAYGTIDLVLTPSGEHVFLEINPAGEYGWIENATRLPISEAIADALQGAPP
jgi:hypothetical protein